jgi:hypothetical protein
MDLRKKKTCPNKEKQLKSTISKERRRNLLRSTQAKWRSRDLPANNVRD